MKARVTISVSKQTLNYVDRLVGKRGRSRSQVIESFIRETQQRQWEEALAGLAREFFAAPELEGESQEREDWLKAGVETLQRDR